MSTYPSLEARATQCLVVILPMNQLLRELEKEAKHHEIHISSVRGVYCHFFNPLYCHSPLFSLFHHRDEGPSVDGEQSKLGVQGKQVQALQAEATRVAGKLHDDDGRRSGESNKTR